MPDRLQKILAQAGYGSRRACEDYITAGRVRVNGQLASLGQKADPAIDKITLDGKPIAAAEALTYIALYKPRNVLSTVESERGDDRQTVRDLVEVPVHLYPVGRLDADATGRFLYYIPGAHGGSETDGSPVIQFDTKTRRKKVIAFLHPFYATKYGLTLKGTFSSALAPEGDKLYITWNVSREGKVWDSVALTVLHIPESERTP